jgi:hypothetical protein
VPRISAGGGAALGGEGSGVDQRDGGSWRSGGRGETPVRGARGTEYGVPSNKSQVAAEESNDPLSV